MGYASPKVGSKVVKCAISFARDVTRGVQKSMQVNLDGASPRQACAQFPCRSCPREHGHDRRCRAVNSLMRASPIQRGHRQSGVGRCRCPIAAHEITSEFGDGIACELRT